MNRKYSHNKEEITEDLNVENKVENVVSLEKYAQTDENGIKQYTSEELKKEKSDGKVKIQYPKLEAKNGKTIFTAIALNETKEKVEGYWTGIRLLTDDEKTIATFKIYIGDLEVNEAKPVETIIDSETIFNVYSYEFIEISD